MGAKARDEHHTPWLIVRREHAHGVQQSLDRRVWPDFDSDGIANSSAEFHVCRSRIARAQSDPREMGREIEPALAARNLARERRFVSEDEQLMAGEEVDALHGQDGSACKRFHET